MISFKEFYLTEVNHRGIHRNSHSGTVGRITKRMGQTRTRPDGSVYNTGVNMTAGYTSNKNDRNFDQNKTVPMGTIPLQKAQELASKHGINLNNLGNGKRLGKMPKLLVKEPNGQYRVVNLENN